MVIVSKRILKVITLSFADAITLFPFIILRDAALARDPVLMRHERIHLRQQAEMLLIPFFLWYLIEYLLRRPGRTHWEAYRSISFEREAFAMAGDADYLKRRRFWAFLHWLGKAQ